MSSQESATASTITAILAITIIICVACACGIDDTLVKVGIAAIAALAGIGFTGIIRRP